jgi:hypothetical protein
MNWDLIVVLALGGVCAAAALYVGLVWLRASRPYSWHQVTLPDYPRSAEGAVSFRASAFVSDQPMWNLTTAWPRATLTVTREKLVLRTPSGNYEFAPKDVTVVLFKTFYYSGARFVHTHLAYVPYIALHGWKKAEEIGPALRAYGYNVVAESRWR